MRLIKIQDIFIIMIVLIIMLSSINLLFYYEDKFLDKEYIIVKDKINISNNESVVLCQNGSYQIITPYDFYICGEPNKNIHIKQ